MALEYIKAMHWLTANQAVIYAAVEALLVGFAAALVFWLLCESEVV